MKKIMLLGSLGLLFAISACQNIKGDPSPSDVTTTSPTENNTGNTSASDSSTTGNNNNCGNTSSNASKGDSICFNTQVLPFIVSNCATSGCHDAKTRADGYELTSYATITKKGISAGSPSKSKIYTVMTRTDNERMPPPPAQALSKAQTDVIAKWISQGAKNVNCAVVVDTQNVTFSKTIMPLLTTNCIGCHKTGSISGGVNLENYTSIKTYVDNKRLYGSVAYQSGYATMPPIGKLTDCQLAVIKKWIDTGAKNN